MTVIISVDLCLQIYETEINAGSLRDRGLLEAAVAAPFAGFGNQEAFPTLIEKAARLANGIAEEAHRRFGRGSGHPARLNFGDCITYALAKDRNEALLFKGDAFTHTDLLPAV